MSEIYIHYGSLENSIERSKKVRNEIENYIFEIKSKITIPISKLSGSDSYSYASTASTLAASKISALYETASRFGTYEASVRNLISIAKDKDNHVSNEIGSIADTYIEKRTWRQKAGDWVYNTFCVDLVNKWDWTRNFGDAAKWSYDQVENYLEKVKDWFQYGDGRYVLNIVTAVGVVIASVAATCVAIAAIPFTAGSSLAVVIGCIGATASAVSTIVTVVNMDSQMRSNAKALELSKDGNLGAARYYGNISSLSGEWAKKDMGGAVVNKIYEIAGKEIDAKKVVADTTAFVCTAINSFGAVRDYRFKAPDEHIKGYSFSLENIKHNLRGEFGFYLTKPGLQIKNLSKLQESIHNATDGIDFFKKQYSAMKDIWTSDGALEKTESKDPFEEIQSTWKKYSSIGTLIEIFAG